MADVRRGILIIDTKFESFNFSELSPRTINRFQEILQADHFSIDVMYDMFDKPRLDDSTEQRALYIIKNMRDKHSCVSGFCEKPEDHYNSGQCLPMRLFLNDCLENKLTNVIGLFTEELQHKELQNHRNNNRTSKRKSSISSASGMINCEDNDQKINRNILIKDCLGDNDEDENVKDFKKFLEFCHSKVERMRLMIHQSLSWIPHCFHLDFILHDQWCKQFRKSDTIILYVTAEMLQPDKGMTFTMKNVDLYQLSILVFCADSQVDDEQIKKSYFSEVLSDDVVIHRSYESLLLELRTCSQRCLV